MGNIFSNGASGRRICHRAAGGQRNCSLQVDDLPSEGGSLDRGGGTVARGDAPSHCLPGVEILSVDREGWDSCGFLYPRHSTRYRRLRSQASQYLPPTRGVVRWPVAALLQGFWPQNQMDGRVSVGLPDPLSQNEAAEMVSNPSTRHSTHPAHTPCRGILYVSNSFCSINLLVAGKRQKLDYKRSREFSLM